MEVYYAQYILLTGGRIFAWQSEEPAEIINTFEVYRGVTILFIKKIIMI